MEAATHLGWQLTRLFLAWSSVLLSVSLFLYLILRPLFAGGNDERAE
jgi:hypothetical protein